MALKAAFIFVAPEVDPAVHRAKVITPAVELTVVAAQNYAQAEQVAQDLVAEGIAAIELCGGFGHVGAGPAGLAAALELNRLGVEDVVVVVVDREPDAPESLQTAPAPSGVPNQSGQSRRTHRYTPWARSVARSRKAMLPTDRDTRHSHTLSAGSLSSTLALWSGQFSTHSHSGLHSKAGDTGGRFPVHTGKSSVMSDRVLWGFSHSARW